MLEEELEVEAGVSNQSKEQELGSGAKNLRQNWG